MSERKQQIEEKIKHLEQNGLWDNEIEENPESTVLMPNKVDYLNKKISSKILTKISNRLAYNFFEKEIKTGNLIIKDVIGLENVRKVIGGAMITCNHFSIYDHYAIYKALRNDFGKKRFLYKIIREGNYTGFKGLFGLFFRHCNTLPLSSNTDTLKKFLKAINVLLARGEKILVYPEQAMWRNYRKPRPFKEGAFKLAVKNKVPVIPAFITMEDTDKLDADGFNIQAYTIWFLEPIYSSPDLSDKENTMIMKEKNYNAVRKLYEKVYGIPLEF